MGGIGCAQQSFAEGTIAEHLRQFGEQLQMGFVSLLGNKQHEQQIDRAPIGRVKLHRGGQPQKRARSVLEALDAAVGNGDSLTEAGGTEAFAGEQAVENQAAGDALMILEQQAGLFENTLLAAGVEIDHHIGEWQELRYQAHSQGSLRSAVTAGAALGDGTDRVALKRRLENARNIPTPRT